MVFLELVVQLVGTSSQLLTMGCDGFLVPLNTDEKTTIGIAI
jgi:hypothetical protein